MKTPDEIKKGLEICIGACRGDKTACPYRVDFDGCLDIMHSDALAYIQQLEADKVSLLESSHEMRKDMCSRIQQLEDKVPKWISVEERLPEGFATVLIMRDDIKQACVGWLIGGHWSVPKGVRVTHWMPLPEPPVEE